MWSIGLLIFAVQIQDVVMDFSSATFLKAEYNDSRISKSIKNLSKSSLLQCATNCKDANMCEAFSFHARGTCEMNQYNVHDRRQDIVAENGWSIFIKLHETCWPSSYDGFVWNGTCYFWPQSYLTVSWIHAQNDCKAHTAKLVCMETEEETSMLMGTVPFTYWWFGGTEEDERSWKCGGRGLGMDAVTLHENGTDENGTDVPYRGYVAWSAMALFTNDPSAVFPYACELKQK